MLPFAMDVKWKMIGNELMQPKFGTDKNRTKKFEKNWL